MEAHLAHNQKYAGSSPVSAIKGRLRVLKVAYVIFKNKPGNRYKAILLLYRILRLYSYNLTESQHNLFQPKTRDASAGESWIWKVS